MLVLAREYLGQETVKEGFGERHIYVYILDLVGLYIGFLKEKQCTQMKPNRIPLSSASSIFFHKNDSMNM